jgi:hypothetical protein
MGYSDQEKYNGGPPDSEERLNLESKPRDCFVLSLSKGIPALSPQCEYVSWR